MGALTPPAEALRRFVQLGHPLPAERVPLAEALGRVPVEPVRSRLPLPAFDHAAMDGYAVRAAEVSPGATLPVAFEVRAGDAARPLPEGRAARIFTGAPIPPGADAVVMQEQTERQGERVRFQAACSPGQHVRRRGEELPAGAELLAVGRPLASGDVALLASQGFAEVLVHARPRVAVVVTGDEVRPPGEPLEAGALYDSNGPMLAAALRDAGALPLRLPAAEDRVEPLAARLGEAARCADLVVTTGGVSVGDHDHVLAAWARLGVERLLWKVAVKPGKPVALGRHLDGTVFVGLPGNPVSAWVTFELLLRPMLRTMLGDRAPYRPTVQVRLDAPVRHRPGRWQAVRARRGPDDPTAALPHPRQASGALPSLAAVDLLLLLPAEAEAPQVGDQVTAVDLHAPGGSPRPYFAG